MDKTLQKTLQKVKEGRKLTSKERRLYAKWEKEGSKLVEDESKLVEEEGAKESLSEFNVLLTNKVVSDGKSIKLENFSINAHGKSLFEDADLKISYPFKYGLIGRNGCGKSTLIKHISERIIDIPKELDLLYVEQEVEGTDLSVLETVLKANTVRDGLIQKRESLSKELERADSPDHLIDQLREVEEELYAIGDEKEIAMAQQVLRGMGFTDVSLPTRLFSGGWRMRISIARALYMRPTLLLLDEPTSHLDLNAVIWLTNYLKGWKNSLVVVSHDKTFLNEVVDQIIEVRDKRLTYYRGNYDKYWNQLNDELTGAEKKWDKLQKQIAVMRKKSLPKTEINSLIKKSSAIRPSKPYLMPIQFPPIPKVRGQLIKFNDISFGYTDSPPLFTRLNFALDQGDRIVIIGENGIGKSTFIKLLADKLEGTEGVIERNSSLRIGYYEQHVSDSLPLDQTPIEHLLSVKGTLTEHDVRKELGMIGLSGTEHKMKIGQLSGGQKVRVALIKLMLDRPNLLLLDEVTNYLDMESITCLINAINKYQGAVVMISHDMELILKTDARLWWIQDGGHIEKEIEWEEYCDTLLV